MIKEERQIKALKDKNIKLNSEINECCYMARVLRQYVKENNELIEELENKLYYSNRVNRKE